MRGASLYPAVSGGVGDLASRCASEPLMRHDHVVAGRRPRRQATRALTRVVLSPLLREPVARTARREFDPQTGTCLSAGTSLYTSTDFWCKGLGIVTPHRAQQSKIVQRLCEVFRNSVAPQLIRSAVDTVERFQGQQRDVIIASYAVGDPDTIGDEVQFLHSLNRFNVLATRARAKLIVLVSQELVHYMAGDIAVLRDSRLLKSFCETFCDRRRPMQLGVVDEGVTRTIDGSFRWRS
jgi:DNA replication ATP-dependent helicase Dna2